MQLRKNFSLRTLLIGLTLTGVAAATVMQPWIQHRAEQAALKTLPSSAKVYDSWIPPS